MEEESLPNFELFNEEELLAEVEAWEKKNCAATLATYSSPSPSVANENIANQQNTSSPTGRFAVTTDEQLEKLKDKSLNENTKRSTNTWVNAYRSWAKEREEREDIENVSPSHLNLLLERFYAELKKKDGSDYEPESLGVMQASLDRFLKENSYEFSIARDQAFTSSRAILSGKATLLRENGKGNRPNSAKALTWDEEEELWKKGKLGDSSPEALLHTVWFLLTQHLGLRGCQEHKHATIEEFKFQLDDEGREYITYEDSKPTKTRKGGIRMKKRAQKPRMFATGGNRCPVSLFKKYLSHRPLHLRSSGPLYLAIIQHPKTDVWYKDQKMGHNRLSDIMKRIVAETSFSHTKRLSNHSGRKTVVKKLDEAAVSIKDHCGDRAFKREIA